MFLYKLNVFHWHLTDDEGWRLEIHSLPNLTRHGAFRGRGHVIEPQYAGDPRRRCCGDPEMIWGFPQS